MTFGDAVFVNPKSIRKKRSAILFSAMMLLTTYSAIEFGAWEAVGSTDADGDGLTYGLEFYIGTQPQDWDLKFHTIGIL